MKAKAFPIIVKRGSASVKIYRPPFRGVDRFTLAFWLDGGRKRQPFGDSEAAKSVFEKSPSGRARLLPSLAEPARVTAAVEARQEALALPRPAFSNRLYDKQASRFQPASAQAQKVRRGSG